MQVFSLCLSPFLPPFLPSSLRSLLLSLPPLPPSLPPLPPSLRSSLSMVLFIFLLYLCFSFAPSQGGGDISSCEWVACTTMQTRRQDTPRACSLSPDTGKPMSGMHRRLLYSISNFISVIVSVCAVYNGLFCCIDACCIIFILFSS